MDFKGVNYVSHLNFIFVFLTTDLSPVWSTSPAKRISSKNIPEIKFIAKHFQYLWAEVNNKET